MNRISHIAPFKISWFVKPSIILAIVLMGMAFAPNAKAHEFWIAPSKWVTEKGQELRVALKIGSDFSGFQQVYMPHKFTRFDLINAEDSMPIKGRIGDRPAGKTALPEDGLYIIRHETTSDTIKYKSLADFTAFTEEKGMHDVAAWHQSRGLPEEGFIEYYRRYAKGLVAAGHAKGQDQVLGMDVEITALDNPFLTNSDTLAIQLSRHGAPWPNVPVRVYAKASGDDDGRSVIKTIYKTDGNGQVMVKVASGYTYLIDAVSLEPMDPASNPHGAVWLTKWASLTFAR